jgi:hypothetical protein
MFEMFMSVHNTINVGRVIYKHRFFYYPYRICLVFWPCQHLLLGKCAIMLVRLVCPRPLLFCSVALNASKHNKVVHMVRILLTWLVECGRFREYLDNNPGRQKWKHRIGRMHGSSLRSPPKHAHIHTHTLSGSLPRLNAPLSGLLPKT